MYICGIRVHVYKCSHVFECLCAHVPVRVYVCVCLRAYVCACVYVEAWS